MVAIQLLDGVAAGIFGVVSVIIAADVMKGTGRFNLARGWWRWPSGSGPASATCSGGFVVGFAGYPVGFLVLAAVALAALVFFALFMPETRGAEDDAAILSTAAA